MSTRRKMFDGHRDADDGSAIADLQAPDDPIGDWHEVIHRGEERAIEQPRHHRTQELRPFALLPMEAELVACFGKGVAAQAQEDACAVHLGHEENEAEED